VWTYALDEYYRILEIQPNASPEEVKAAYRDQAKVWHPDRFANDPRMQLKAQERMRRINDAYARLRNNVPESAARPGPTAASREGEPPTPPRSEQSQAPGGGPPPRPEEAQARNQQARDQQERLLREQQERIRRRREKAAEREINRVRKAERKRELAARRAAESQEARRLRTILRKWRKGRAIIWRRWTGETELANKDYIFIFSSIIIYIFVLVFVLTFIMKLLLN
jgi:curved DNA-binding protein CbpA